MPDREKVIKGLECCTREYGCASDCPYFKGAPMTDGICITAVQADALALLKEQEPAKPREERHEVKVNHDWGDEVEVWSEFYCPHCGAIIAKGKSEHYPRCMWCGQEVKWE